MSEASGSAAPLTDKEQEGIRAWFQSHWQHGVQFNLLLGLDFTVWTPERVCAEVRFDDRLSAHDGIFHGGVISTLIDTVGTGAVIAGHDYNHGSRCTTIDMTVQYYSVAPGEDLVAEGVCTRRGKRISFADVVVRSSETHKDLAHGVLTASVFGRRPGLGRAEGPSA